MRIYIIQPGDRDRDRPTDRDRASMRIDADRCVVVDPIPSHMDISHRGDIPRRVPTLFMGKVKLDGRGLVVIGRVRGPTPDRRANETTDEVRAYSLRIRCARASVCADTRV